jgi:hypothetical protein
MKLCRRCKIEKSRTEFFRHGTSVDGRQAYCKPCQAEYKRTRPHHMQKWRQIPENLEKQRQYDSDRNLRRYGLSRDEFKTILESQNGCCAICLEVLQKPQIDHCHTTGNTRGILCLNCNHGLGKFRDSEFLLKNAILYLQCPPVKKVFPQS